MKIRIVLVLIISFLYSGVSSANPVYDCMREELSKADSCDFSFLDQRFIVSAERKCVIQVTTNGGDVTASPSLKEESTRSLTAYLNEKIIECGFEGSVDLNPKSGHIDISLPGEGDSVSR